MKIHVLSDLHLEFRAFEMPVNDADVVVLAGDIHLKSRALGTLAQWTENRPIIYVAGNHEFYGGAIPRLYVDLAAATDQTQIRFLQNSTAIVSGTRFLGCTLWTDYGLLGDDCREMAMLVSSTEMTDFRKIRVSPDYRKVTPTLLYSMHRRSLDWLETELSHGFDGKTVVVTHHAPSALSLDPNEYSNPISASYSISLENLIDSYRIDLWIHGHTHRSVDYVHGKRVY